MNLRCNTQDLTRKKISFFYIHFPFDFHKGNVYIISFHLNKYSIDYVKDNVLNGTKLIDINIFS